MLSLLSKTVTVTLPAALLVIFWWRRGRLSWPRDVRPLLPFFGISAAFGIFVAWLERRLAGAEGKAFEFTIIERCLIAGRAMWFYLGKLVYPVELTFMYPRWHISQAIWWQYLFPMGALLLVAVLWGLRRRLRGPLAATLFFAGTLLPLLGFFNAYLFIYTFVADHFQYLASLGIIVLASAGVALLLERWRLWGRPVAYCTCGILLMILATLTWRQSRMYANIDMLWQTTIQRNPECCMAHDNFGVVLAKRGQIDAAIVHFRKALEISPEDTRAHANLGNVLASQQHFNEAIAEYQRALDISPNFVEARFNLGNVLALQGHFDASVAEYQRALEIRPDFAEARENLAVVSSRRENPPKKSQ